MGYSVGLRIDVGPMLLNIDSYISEGSGNPSVRDWFSQNDYITLYIGQFDPIPGGVDDQQVNLPKEYGLYPCFPNPCNARTVIQFDLRSRGRAHVQVLNILGQRISVLIDRVLPPGSHRAFWDGTDERGRAVASSVYFCRLKSGGFVDTEKMILLI